MFAIQSGSKFLKADTWAYGDHPIYGVAVTSTPKTYKTKADADLACKEIIDWLSLRAQHAVICIESGETDIAEAKAKVERLEAKLEKLMDMPYRQVNKQVQQTRDAIERARRDAKSAAPSVRSFRQDLARYNKILNMSIGVVKLGYVTTPMAD